MHDTYRDFILARVQAAIGAARAARGITHRGLLGEIREALIRDLFRPLLPADIGIGTGQIISHTNQTSTQTDIILYDRRILPPVLFQDASGVFPVESVLYAVEVKSKLTATELKQSHDSAAALDQLTYSPLRYNPSGVPTPHVFVKLVPTLIALDSDLSPGGMSEIERYDRMCDGRSPQLKAVCVVGRGYWYRWEDQWRTWSLGYEFGEVVSFIGGIMNTYGDIARTRGQPRLGRYLIDD